MIGTEEKYNDIKQKNESSLNFTQFFKKLRINIKRRSFRNKTKNSDNKNLKNKNQKQTQKEIKMTTPSGKRVLLIILDGWGIGNKGKGDVIYNTPTPYYDYLLKTYPNSTLDASGELVGLPEGQMGNSEVGHSNIGAGRVLYQDLVKINIACRDNSIKKNPGIVKAFEYVKKNNKKLHFLGLVSDGGVHSHIEHLFKLCDISKEYGLKKTFVHCFMDGRDCDPRSGKGYIEQLVKKCKETDVNIATIIGRYYAMDRDTRWERVAESYNSMVHGKGKLSNDMVKAVQESYDEDVTDEFIKPIVNSSVDGKIEEGDAVIFFNFRNDRARELTICLSQNDIPNNNLKVIPGIQFFTMTPYDSKFKNVNVLFEKDNVENTMGELVSKAGMKQLRIAETEKFPHVTFFFSGGRSEEFPGEDRVLIPSPKVATYDLKPEMSIYEVTEALDAALKKDIYSMVVLNYAIGDMVGHTGVYPAIEKAVVAVSDCLSRVVETAKVHDYEVVIIADHGNCDNAINPDGTPNTAHSTNKVPFIYVTDKKNVKIQPGRLCDVAPCLCKILGLEVPKEMTGKCLIDF